jgi:hypothetical protein
MQKFITGTNYKFMWKQKAKNSQSSAGDKEIVRKVMRYQTWDSDCLVYNQISATSLLYSPGNVY